MNFPNLGVRLPTGWRGRGVLLLCGLAVSAVVCGFSFSSPDAGQNGEVDTDLDGWADNVDSNPVSRAVFLWGRPDFTYDTLNIYVRPSWALDGWMQGGAWITNAPWFGWQPGLGDWQTDFATNRLLMQVDRTLMSNNLWLAVAASLDNSNTFLFAGLLDSNLEAVSQSQLLNPGVLSPWYTNRLDLATNPAASVISIFSTGGIARVYASMLYEDDVGDGLDNDQRAQLAWETAITNGSSSATNAPPATTNTPPAVNGLRIGFETSEGYAVGPLNGQNGWTASNEIAVASGGAAEGTQYVRRSVTNENIAGIERLVETNAATGSVVWVSMSLKWSPVGPAQVSTQGVSVALAVGDGRVLAFDGVSHNWRESPQSFGFQTGAWTRFDVRVDYAARSYSVYCAGKGTHRNVGFADLTVSRLSFLEARFGPTDSNGGMDAILVSNQEPSGLDSDDDGITDAQERALGTNPFNADSDGDGMPDAWEVAHGLNPLDPSDAALDPDNDGLANLQECLHGADPHNPDTDGDGIPDGWEVAHGLNPLVNDAALDPDNDGLTNLQEYLHGTDPHNRDSDGDGLSDGDEVNSWHSNPLTTDTDGDGFSDADEVARDTDPADPTSYPASHWRNRLQLTFRDGSATNRLTGVPVLVRLTPERIDYSQCAPDGHDILFTDNAGSPLAFEMERWIPGGESLFWVRLPEIGTTNAANSFYLHWNYPAATNAANPVGVWGTNYAGVWHLDETSNILSDVTVGAHAATNIGAVCVTGILGNARNFRGSDSIIVPPVAFASINNAVSISFWQYGDPAQPRNDTCFEGTSAVGRELNAHLPWGDGNVYWDAFGNYDRINQLAVTNFYKSAWNHWTFTKDRAAGTMTIYLNGERWLTATGKTRAYTPVTSFRFGSAADGGWGYLGLMDELRVETVAQSPAWIRFQYQTMLDQVLIYGEQQVSIAATANGAEPNQPGAFTVTRTAQTTNLPLTVALSMPGGTATEGVDFTVLPRSVVIPAGSLSATLSVPVIADFLLEGPETVTLSLAASGTYRINPTNATASIVIADDDVDTDGNGMSDAWQLAHFTHLGVSPTADADNDGLANLQEFLHGTDPHNPDTDGDGIPDGWEVAHGLNPLVNDAALDPDNDGLTNLQEYILGTDPHNPDTDGDGMPDGWEVAHGLNPLVNDAALDPDNDGLTNLQEYLHGTDPHNPDTDGDGLSDGAEVNVHHTNPLNPDTDGDGMPDKWEVNAGTNPLVNDTAQDSDHDGLTHMQEYLLGTNPLLADTDGDGISDGDEVNLYHTDPFAAASLGAHAITLLTIDGASVSATLGGWTPQGTSIVCTNHRGWVEYSLPVATAGVFRLEVDLSQGNPYATRNSFKLIAHIDNEFAGRDVLVAPFGSNGIFRCITPFLPVGTHTLNLYWDNVYDGPLLSIRTVRMVDPGGSDTNGNGLSDWIDQRFAIACSLDTTNRASLVSPACIEGRGWYPSLMGLTINGITNATSIKPLEGNRWYADVPLATNDETAVAISFQNGACVRSHSIAWTPLNLLSGAACPMLRCGDALQFTAYPSGATSGVVSITVDGQTHQTTPAAPVICRFTNAGVHTVSGTYSAGAPVSTSITVTVVGGGFPTNEPVCWWGKSRTWNCPNLPAQAAVEGGSNLTVGKSATTVTLLLAEGDAEHYVAARLGSGGPVLDSRRIAKMWLRAAVDGVVYKIGQEGDGTAIVQNRMTTATFPATATVQLQIFKSGVTFADGTVNKYVGHNDLDERGEYIYQFYMAPSVVGGPCHNIIVSQGSERVGVR